MDAPTYEELLDALQEMVDGALHLSRGGQILIDGTRVGICDHCGGIWPCRQARIRYLMERAHG